MLLLVLLDLPSILNPMLVQLALLWENKLEFLVSSVLWLWSLYCYYQSSVLSYHYHLLLLEQQM
jgi:hypothetical protein